MWQLQVMLTLLSLLQINTDGQTGHLYLLFTLIKCNFLAVMLILLYLNLLKLQVLKGLVLYREMAQEFLLLAEKKDLIILFLM